MWSPISAVIASLYLEDFEERILSLPPTTPKIWKRIMLTTLKTEWCRRFSTGAFQHSTTNHPFYNGDWKLQYNSFSWHIGHKRFRRTPHYKCLRKPYAQFSLPYDSHHAQSVKRDVVKCLYDRSKNIITKSSVTSEEKKHFASVLVSNGYP